MGKITLFLAAHNDVEELRAGEIFPQKAVGLTYRRVLFEVFNYCIITDNFCTAVNAPNCHYNGKEEDPQFTAAEKMVQPHDNFVVCLVPVLSVFVGGIGAGLEALFSYKQERWYEDYRYHH